MMASGASFVLGVVDKGQILSLLFPPDCGVPHVSLPGQTVGSRHGGRLVSAIASTFKHTGLLYVGHEPALTALLTSFSRECPKTPRVFTPLDLSLVLMVLTRAPFEALQLAAPKFLAWKVFFLILLTLGARRSEPNAIKARSIQHKGK